MELIAGELKHQMLACFVFTSSDKTLNLMLMQKKNKKKEIKILP